MMCIDINPITTPRANINSLHNPKQTTYRIQPWGQSSSHLPIILKRGAQPRKSVSELKQKMKITAFYSNNNSRDKQARLNKDYSANSLCMGKYKKTSKYDSNIYRTKTIKNFDLVQEEYAKEKIRRKLSKKILFKKDKIVGQPQLSQFSTCNSQQKMKAKASRRLELERKIFMMLSKDKL